MQTDARRRAEAQAELERLLREAVAGGIGAAELEAAKAYARADFWRDNETRERRAATLAFLEGSGLSYRLAGELRRAPGADRSGGIQRLPARLAGPRALVHPADRARGRG